MLDGVLALLLFLIASGAFDLNRPWLKHRVQAYVHASNGLDVDYASARMSLLHGVVIDDFVVRAPPEARRFATDLLRARHVEARWSPSSLFGRGPPVEQVDMSDVTLTIVVVGSGAPAESLSRKPSELLRSPPLTKRLNAARANAALIRTERDRIVARDDIRGLDVALVAEPDQDGWRVRASARGALVLAAELTASTLTATADLNLFETGDWHARATARFEPGAHRTMIDFDDVRIAGGAATARGQIEVPDEGDPILRHAEGDADGARVLPWLPAGLVPIEAERATLHYRIDSALLGPTLRLGESGRLQLEAKLSKAKLRTADVVIEADEARLALDGRPSEGSRFALQGLQELDGVRIEGAAAGLHVEASDLSLDVDGERAQDGGFSGRVAFRFGRLRQTGSEAVLVAREGHGEVHLEQTREAVSADVAALDVRAKIFAHRFATAHVDAVKEGDAIDYALVARSTGLALRSKGRLERIASRDPWLEQKTAIDVDHPVFHGLSARSLSLSVQARGTVSHHEAVARVRARGLAIRGLAPTDTTALVSATLDRHPWSLRFDADVDGHAHAKVGVRASFDPGAGAIAFDVDANATSLAPLSPLVAGFDLSRSELGLAARGTLSGVDSPDPWRTAALEGSADLRVAHFHGAWKKVEVAVPSFVWHGDMQVEGDRRTLRGHADVDSVRLGLGPHQIDLAGLSDDANVTVTGDLKNPAIDVIQRGTIRDVEQDYLPYAVGNVRVALSGKRGRDGLVRISRLSLQNGIGGTTLEATGGIDPEGKRPHLTLTANLVQDLAALSAFPSKFSGTGEVEVAAKLESPDLKLYRSHLEVKVRHARVRMPNVGIDADAIDGEIPISVAFEVKNGAVAINRNVVPSPFARLGLADRPPLLRRRGFVTIGRLTTPRVSIAPFVGNISVEQNVVALEQLEMGVRGGWLTGESVLEWDGARSKLDTHLRASGVRSSRGEPFDGNFAIVVGADNRMIEGRAEIIRMGKQHLLDLLDVEDPLHVDEAMNHVRTALAWGHPKRVRVDFENGFANAHIELGGLAAFIHVPDLRGIRTGPLVDRLVESVVGKAAP